MLSTNFLPASAIFSNGQITGNLWGTPNDIFLVDGNFATSDTNTGSASDFIISNFNHNLPQDAVPTGIEIQIIGKRGAQTSPVISLDVSVYDNVDGASAFYPYLAPITSLTESVSTITIGSSTYQFATAFSVDQINNLKLALTANGDISLDCVLVKVHYFIQSPVTPPVVVGANCEECNSPIQVQAMYLELPFLIGETKFYLKKGSFAYPNGVPVQPGDLGTCGGTITFVFDESKSKTTGGNWEENVSLPYDPEDVNTPTWTVLPSGVIEVDIKTVNNRGLDYKTPGEHVAGNMSNHDANSKVIISNNEPYNLSLVRRCQEGTVFSAPIETLQEEVSKVLPTVKFNFKGSVSVVQNGVDPEQADITITAGGGTLPPSVVGVGSGTSGNVQVDTLTYTVPVSGLNRGALIQISTEELVTVVSVDVGGTAAVQVVSQTDAPNNLRSEQWICVAPPLGTQTVTITLSAVAYISSGTEVLAGVDPVTPTGSFAGAGGTDTNPTVGLVTTYDNSLIFDGLVTALTPILYTEGAGQTLNWSHTANTDTRQGGSSVEPSGLQPDAITMDYAITQNTDWVITAVEVKGITTASATGQSGIQWEDEGVNLGAPATVDEVDFTGAGVTASRLGNKVTVNIPGGTGLSLETDGVANGDQTLLNLIAGTGINLTDDGLGGVTIDATGAGGGGSNIIENLTAGEDIDGVTEPCVVFLGTNSATPSLAIAPGNPYVGHTLAYDWTQTVGATNQTVSALARRASPITTPAHFTTVNQILVWVMESTTTSTINQNVEIGIYDDNAGEPGTLIANFTDTSYPVSNSNSYGYSVNLGVNVQLAASTTYWIVVEFVTDGATPLNFYQSTDPVGGLVFSGGIWVASSVFMAGVILAPYENQVYKSYYAVTSDEERKKTLGITTQNVAEGNPIDVIHDGVVAGYTGLTATDVQYVSTNVPGEIQTSSADTVKIATATKATEIVINRVATYQ